MLVKAKKKVVKIVVISIQLTILLITLNFLRLPNSAGPFYTGIIFLVTARLLVFKEKKYKTFFPSGLELFINLALLSHVLGYGLGFYSKFDLYDKYLHLINSIIAGVLGYAILISYQIRHGNSINHKFAAFFAITFATFFGNLWELVEFSIDQLRRFDFSVVSDHTQLQWGLQDTMKDILFNAIGGLIAGAFGWIIYRKKEAPILEEDLAYLVAMFK